MYTSRDTEALGDTETSENIGMNEAQDMTRTNLDYMEPSI